MRPSRTAVVQHVVVVATRVLQRIGENRHAVERPLRVDACGKRDDIGREPRRGDGDEAEGVTEDAAKKDCLGDSFRSLTAIFCFLTFAICLSKGASWLPIDNGSDFTGILSRDLRGSSKHLPEVEAIPKT